MSVRKGTSGVHGGDSGRGGDQHKEEERFGRRRLSRTMMADKKLKRGIEFVFINGK
jgi:hypothetical protein